MKAKWNFCFVLQFLLACSRIFAAPGSGPVADLSVSITGPTSASISNSVSFSYTITNNGPSNAPGPLYISNYYSPGLQFSGQGGYAGSYSSGNPATWYFSTGVPTNYSGTITVTFTALSNGVMTNTLIAYVPAGVTDPNTNNNIATASVTVSTPTCDFAMRTTVTTNVNPSTNLTVPIGSTLTFNASLTNLGPSNYNNYVYSFIPIPTNSLPILSNTVGTYGDTYYPPAGTWTLPKANANFPYNLGITVYASNVGTFTIPTGVEVPSGVLDPNLANNSNIVMITVRNPVADLAIGKTASTNRVTVGQQVVFTLSLTNLGPDYIYTNSGPITVMDLLPAGFNYLFDNGSGAYNASAGIWTLPSLATMTPATLQITAAGAAIGTYTNTSVANVPPTITDTNLTNNSSSVVVMVVTNGTTNTGSYTLSGYALGCATNGAGFAYVTITLTGGTNLTTMTGTNGFYSFSGLPAATYAVTPSLPGTTFAPGNAVVNLSSNTTVAPFVSGQSIIQGVVTYGTNGPGVPNIPIQLAGDTNRNTLTDAGGHYIFTNCQPGTYTVFASAANGYNLYSGTSPVLSLSATNCNAQANFVAMSRTVQLVAMEVTQVIQDWSNSVPLVANKTTYLRAHFQQPYTTNQFGRPVNPAPLLLTGATLINAAQPNAPVTPVNQDGALSVTTTNAYAVRGNWASAMDFKLPAAWCTAGSLTLKLICTNQITVVPTNTVPANFTIAVTFSNVPVLPLKYFGFNWTNAGTLTELDQTAYTNLPSRLVSMYPVPDITASQAIQYPISVLSVPAAIPPAIAATEKLGDWVILNSNAKLALCHVIDTLLGGRFATGGSNWIYVGALAGPTPTGTTGWAGAIVTSSNTLSNNADMNVCSAFVISGFYNTTRHTIQHEVGHCLGRPHDVKANGTGICGEGGPMMAYPLMQNVPPPAGPLEPSISPMLLGTNGLVFGLDTLTLVSAAGAQQPVVSPYSYFDIMSYCKNAPLDRWISPYTYGQMQAVISNNFTPPAVAAIPGPSKTWVYVRGFIDSVSGIGGFLPFWSVTTTATNIPSDAGPGPYTVIVYDIHGTILEEVPFNPSLFDVEDTDDSAIDEYQFQVAVPEVANMAAIEIMDTTNNQSIASIVDSNSPPAVSSVSLYNTNGGPYNGTGPLVINWLNSYSGTNALFYTLQYSTDGGQTWETLDIDISALTYQISSLYLPATTTALIRIFASDGFYTSAPAYSSTFTVPNHPPLVSINTPAQGGIYTLAQQIFFNATVIDPQDGPLNGNSVQWFSSINGFLGYGTDLPIQASALSPGLHTITVSATDAESLNTTASVQIYVLDESIPTLSIANTGNQVVLSWPSADTNFYLISTTNLETAIWSPVTNVPVAMDAFQSVSLKATNTAEFFQLVLP